MNKKSKDKNQNNVKAAEGTMPVTKKRSSASLHSKSSSSSAPSSPSSPSSSSPSSSSPSPSPSSSAPSPSSSDSTSCEHRTKNNKSRKYTPKSEYRDGSHYIGDRNVGGCPYKEINKDTFEKLCSIQCTQAEICAVLDVNHETLERWCERTYNKKFAIVYKEKRGVGKVSLRRMQFEMASNNVTMAIWLGKQMLGQTDNGPVVEDDTNTIEEDSLSRSLRELGEKL